MCAVPAHCTFGQPSTDASSTAMAPKKGALSSKKGLLDGAWSLAPEPYMGRWLAHTAPKQGAHTTSPGSGTRARLGDMVGQHSPQAGQPTQLPRALAPEPGLGRWLANTAPKQGNPHNFHCGWLQRFIGEDGWPALAFKQH